MKGAKTILVIIAGGALGFTTAVLWIGRQPYAVAVHETPIQSEVTEPSRVDMPPSPTRPGTPPRTVPLGEVAAILIQRGPEDWLNELATLQVTSGPGQGRAQYRILGLLDQLAQAGTPALPALRQFLASNRDVVYGAANNGRSGLLPESLRFGLWDVVRQIGGAEGEQVLAESLNSTVHGAELGYLAQLLEATAPGKYRDATLGAAKKLLASGKTADAAERNNLFDILRQFKDTSYLGTAQAQLVQADGKVDRSALRYLQGSLGDQTLDLATKTFQDGRVVDSDSREALGRVALNYVGINDSALELFHQAALDPQIRPDQRRNLVEDLNQDGLSNRKNPTAEDLTTIAKRYELTQAYLQQDYVKNDPTLNAAFLEANKDLKKMLQKAGIPLPAMNP